MNSRATFLFWRDPMSNKLRELQARKANLVKDARTLTDIAAAEERDMSDEELTAFDSLKSKIEAA